MSQDDILRSKDDEIAELKEALLTQEETWEKKLKTESDEIQQNFLLVHEKAVEELNEGHAAEMSAMAERCQLWEARAHAAAKALETLESEMDEREAAARVRMEKDFVRAHADDVQELCDDIANLRDELEDHRRNFADKLESKTEAVVNEAVACAVTSLEEEYKAQQEKDAGMIRRLQKALATALSMLRPS